MLGWRVILSACILLAGLWFVSGATLGVWIAIAACWLLMAMRLYQAEAHHREVIDNLTRLRKLERLQFPLGTDLGDL